MLLKRSNRRCYVKIKAKFYAYDAYNVPSQINLGINDTCILLFLG